MTTPASTAESKPTFTPGKSLQVPTSSQDLAAIYPVKRKFSLSDQVEPIYITLFDNANFRALRNAVNKEETVEGSFNDDDSQSADMIRVEARSQGIKKVADASLTEIRHAIGVVERRVPGFARTYRIKLAKAQKRQDAEPSSDATSGTDETV